MWKSIAANKEKPHKACPTLKEVINEVQSFFQITALKKERKKEIVKQYFSYKCIMASMYCNVTNADGLFHRKEL